MVIKLFILFSLHKVFRHLCLQSSIIVRFLLIHTAHCLHTNTETDEMSVLCFGLAFEPD